MNKRRECSREEADTKSAVNVMLGTVILVCTPTHVYKIGIFIPILQIRKLRLGEVFIQGTTYGRWLSQNSSPCHLHYAALFLHDFLPFLLLATQTSLFTMPQPLCSSSFTAAFSSSKQYSMLPTLTVVRVFMLSGCHSFSCAQCASKLLVVTGRGPAEAREPGHWSEQTGVSHGMKCEVCILSPGVREAWKTG